MGVKAIPVETINNRLPKESNLTALYYIDNHISKSGIIRRKVMCRCICGNVKDCIVADLIRGNPLSCGCSSIGRKSKYKFGDASIYKKWYDMRERCYNPKNPSYKNYGAIGVTVCDEWKNSYEPFAIWALNSGYSPELQLDKDINGDGKLYSPETCSWVTQLKNMSNRTCSVKYNFKGQLLTIPEISRLTGILQSNLKSAIINGKSIDEAVNPPDKTPKFKRY